MDNLTAPSVIPMPFADQGDKNTIPASATGTQLASFEEGFPEITQTAIEEGGVPPERADFNGILNQQSEWQFAFQNGWLPTFDENVSAAIGGYAQGAVLWYAPTSGQYANTVIPLRSLIDNNTYNFNDNNAYIGVYWGEVGLSGRANIDLSNLSSSGESHFDNTYSTIDMDNVSNTGTSTAAKWPMPSSTYETLVAGASGSQYTAVANGWVWANGQQTSSGGWMALVSSVCSRAQTSYNNSIHDIYIPVKKGDAFELHYTNMSINTFRFIYAEGSKSEAN